MIQGPTVKDWLLLIVSLLFVAGGVPIMLADPDSFRTAVACMAFFSACSLIAIWIIVRKLRFAAQLREPGSASIHGCVAIPVDRRKRWIGAIGLTVLGSIMAWGGAELGQVFTWLSMFMAGVGLVMAIGLALGLIGHEYLVFEPAGIRMGNRHYSYLIAWDHVAVAEIGDHHDNPVLRIQVRDTRSILASLRVERGSPSASRPHLERALARSRTWFGCPVALFPEHYGLDSARLLRAVARYIAEPAARAELARRPEG